MGERRERYRRYRAASWEEREREREKRGKRERQQVGFCLLKEGVQHMYTEPTQQARVLPAYWTCTWVTHSARFLRGRPGVPECQQLGSDKII